ncbi:MAG: class I SAM-dependent methyltransferase [Candidatus Micrarchaeia archaeon]
MEIQKQGAARIEGAPKSNFFSRNASRLAGLFSQKEKPTSLYSMDPSIYDSYILTEIEKRNFDAVFGAIKSHAMGETMQGMRHVSILDFCCGTGVFPRNWLAKRMDASGFTYKGVDSSLPFLQFAALSLAGRPNVSFALGDAAKGTFLLAGSGKYDIVMATSGYHHIEDGLKAGFLLNMKRHLADGGRIVIYEKFVTPFSNPVEAVRAGSSFYTERICDIMAEQELSRQQVFALYNELYLTAIRSEEFKVPLAVFEGHAKAAGLEIIKTRRLWPSDGRFGNPDVGDFVLELAPCQA